MKLSEQLRLKNYSIKTYTLNICIQEKKKELWTAEVMEGTSHCKYTHTSLKKKTKKHSAH